MRIVVQLSQVRMNLKFSGIELSIIFQELLDDKDCLDTYLVIISDSMKRYCEGVLPEDFVEFIGKHKDIKHTISLVAEYIRLFEGIDATVTIDISPDGEMEFSSSANAFNMSFYKLIQFIEKLR